MSDTIVRSVRTVPTLTPEQVATLPGRRPASFRVLLAFTATVVTFLGLGYGASEYFELAVGGSEEAKRFAWFVAPWLLTLPWFRLVDLRPVPWFFLCMFFGLIAAPILVGKVVSRIVALPYRDWPVEYWHASRARKVPGVRAWTVVPAADAGPYHRPPGERPLRIGWVVVVVTAIPVVAWEDTIPGLVDWTWVGAVATLVISGLVLERIERRRLASAQRVVAEPDQAHDGQAGEQERRGQQ